MNMPNPEENFSDVEAEATKAEAETQKVETKAAQAEAPAASKNAVSVLARPSGMLVGRTFEEQWKIATLLHRSKMLPRGYDTPEKVMAGMQFAYELGLKPLLAMRQICVINGTPNLFGDLPLAVVRNSGQLEYIREYWVDAKGERIDFMKTPEATWTAAVCELRRKGMEARREAYTVADAKLAKLWGVNVWAVHPKRMCQLRVRGWLLKDEFGDVLGGAGIAEYDHNLIPEEGGQVIEAEHRRVDAASNINERFGKPVAEAQVSQ